MEKIFLKTKDKGVIMVYLIIVIFVFLMIMQPVVSVMVGKFKLLRTTIDREMALQIAEAGINYYQWRLAHFPEDYTDGTGQAGPYLHDYKDKDTQETVGQFSLVITPPSSGSTVVQIESTGWGSSSPNIKRTVTVKYGIQSMAKYAFLSNDVIWIGDMETVNGLMHSNNGIRFDGVGNAPITSAKSTYSCPGSQGSPCPADNMPGVWGSASQDVQNFWKYPVPAIDFSSLTSDFAGIKELAEIGGIYLAPSNKQGYSLVFSADGKVSVYKVVNLENNDYKKRNFEFVQDVPQNGIIYAEDNVWVEGVVKGKVTVAAAVLPYDSSNAPTIYIPNNIVYSDKDGSDVLGLISQKDVYVTYSAPTNLEVDAALVAQTGSVRFPFYSGNIKDSISVYGSIMSFIQWTWTWVSGSTVVSGYRNTYSSYDANLLYGPPPSFPLSPSGYQTLDWSSN